MLIYPFNYKITCEVNDVQGFKKELQNRTASSIGTENSKTIFHGKISETSFIVQAKMKYYNFFRPSIKGEFTQNRVVFKIDTHKRVYWVLVVWELMFLIMLLSSDATNKYFFGLIIFFVIAAFWYVGGLIFTSIDIGRTKKAMRIIEEIGEGY